MYAFFKRIFDLTASTAGLLVLSPLLILIALLVKTTSQGPVFFRQLRVGRGNGRFRIFKFRTMSRDAHAGPPVTAKDDARITGIGKFLRLTKLDELPQLFNVVSGAMSIVGPRPEIPGLVEYYTEEQRLLLTVKPGITSPATIYHRDEEEITGTPEEVVEYHKNVLIPRKAQYDLAYIENRSFWYDLKIILLTLLSIITNESGYLREKTIKNRRALIIAAIVLLSCLSYLLAYYVRFDWDIPVFYVGKFKRTLPMALMIKLIFLGFYGQLAGYWRYVGINDVVSIIKALIVSALTMLLLEFFFLDRSFPTSVVLIDFAFSLLLLSGQRLSLRLLREAYAPIVPKPKENVLIVGAGDRGERILREIRQNPDLAFHVLGFVDRSAAKMKIKIHGIPVLSTFDHLLEVVEGRGVTVIINTLDNLSQAEAAVFTRARAQFKCSIRNMPSPSEYFSGKISARQIKEVRIEDLLGRESVELDRGILEKEFAGKTILVTGAGGSIGSELVRQVLRFGPAKLLLLDKDETLLYELETDLQEAGFKPCWVPLLGDIRNREKIDTYFKAFRPQVLLHSAAYKHVPLMERYPHEAVHNNIFGTKNVLSLAVEHGVERFVMISTDKAVGPTNVMGATKRLSEKLMFQGMRTGAMKCMAVRFGNVLGSRGSVIPLFRRQIERGGPVRITHPGIKRFFMSIPEAAQLVLQAGAMGRGGEIFILKMGDPVIIRDLACRLIEFSGYLPEVDIAIEYVGLRPGEKLAEELFTDKEQAKTTAHEKILVIDNRLDFDPRIADRVESLEKDNLNRFSNNEIKGILKELVPEYIPQME